VANITNGFMINSGTGRRIEATNKEKIKEFINMLDERTYRKALRTGYLYTYDFYSGDKMLLAIVGCGNNVHTYNQERTIDSYYDVSKEISLAWIEKWFNSIRSKKYWSVFYEKKIIMDYHSLNLDSIYFCAIIYSD